MEDDKTLELTKSKIGQWFPSVAMFSLIQLQNQTQSQLANILNMV
jgi:hypothetical protein